MVENVNDILDIRSKALNVVEAFGRVANDGQGDFLVYLDPIMEIAYIDNAILIRRISKKNSEEFEPVFVWLDTESLLATFVFDENWVKYLNYLDFSATIKKYMIS